MASFFPFNRVRGPLFVLGFNYTAVSNHYCPFETGSPLGPESEVAITKCVKHLISFDSFDSSVCETDTSRCHSYVTKFDMVSRNSLSQMRIFAAGLSDS